MPLSRVRLVLASASPRRADLLTAAGFEYTVEPTQTDETPLAGEPPAVYVRRIAQAKVDAVGCTGDAAVLGADTVVVVDGGVLGKPADRGEAAAMLRRLSGRRHDVMTAVCLAVATAGDRRTFTAVERTTVEFAPLTAEEIAWYVATDEPFDKAGGYAIQGLASRFVTRIEGSYGTVVGLPVATVYDLCKRAGLLIS